MSDKKPKKGKKERQAPDKLLKDFLKLHDMILIVDETRVVNNVADELVYTVEARPRIRILYKDQLQVEQKPQKENGEKVEITN